MTERTWECWAMVYDEGFIITNSHICSEREAWRQYFGLRNVNEMTSLRINQAKDAGVQVIRVRITELSEVEDGTE